MKCLFCKKHTYYEPYSKSVHIKNEYNIKIYRCIDCNAQFTLNKNNELRHIAFFVNLKNKSYYISQYPPRTGCKGNTSISTKGEKIIITDFIENLSPSNVEKKLKLLLVFK